MNPEPLTKEKIILSEHDINIDEERYVSESDIKSAVEWLLKEIEKKENEVNMELSEILDGKKKDTAVNRGALYGWGEALFWVKQKIKKAFSGVLEE